MNEEVKILIVDDHPLIAQATQYTLEQMPGIQVIGIAGNGKMCMELIDQHQPDIVFLDFQLPDQYGDEVAKWIKTKYPQIHIVIFSGIDITDLLNHFIELKVSGIVSKESGGDTLRDLVKSLLKNQTVLPLSLFHQMRFIERNPQPQLLTEDEVLMMTRVVEGFTNEQIGDEIHMSKRSVDNYLRRIYEKFGVKSRSQAIEKFVQSKNNN
jgi:two-component system competent response regulator ComA